MGPGTADKPSGVRIELLGPVEARVDGRPVALGGGIPRALLAVLALADGRVRSTDDLTDELWGDAPPSRARESLQMHVSRLRRAFAAVGADADRLASSAGGYLLRLEEGERDLDLWEHALAAARRAREAGELRAARARIEDALGVWRGQPFGGVSANSLLAAERARLEEARLAAVIEGLELDLELGRHADVLGQLEALVIAHPFKERPVELQMLALYRSGRQADALDAYHAARRRFLDELGIEPAQRMRDLHDRVLRHADGLAPHEPPPPPATLGDDPTLLLPPNRTIGRSRDLQNLGERVRAGSVRLLTLTGPGGVGKTRLASEVARALSAEFADGARFVALAGVARAEDVPAAIATTLGIVQLEGESPGDTLQRFLATKHLLLVVDNVEHVLEAAGLVGALLGTCPALTVLATSREPLDIQAEERFPVSPLALPDERTLEDALADVAAVELFTERARAHDPGFRLSPDNGAAVADICRRVDGLPLAIELAAARIAILSPGEIAERLDEALAGAGAGPRDAPARQQTLRATIDWSHDLLSDEERACFARFAVFAGGATIQAAETITAAGLDTLERLVAKSLIVSSHHPPGPTRLSMLETIRAYAGERFAAAPDHDAVRASHHRFHLTLARRDGTKEALWGTRRKEHLARLDDEIDNLHAALGWAVGQHGAEPALELCDALGWYWLMRDRYTDAVGWIEQALRLPGADAHPALRVRALCIKSWAVWPLGRGAEQPALTAEAEAIARDLADPLTLSRVLETRSGQESGRDDPLDLAEGLADEALALAAAADDDRACAMASFAKAMAASSASALRERVAQAARLLEDVGDVYHLADLLASAAYVALLNGSDRDAREFVDRATPVTRALDNPYLWTLLRGNAGLTALLAGDSDAAAEAFSEELRLCRELVVRPFASEGLNGLAAVASIRADRDRAARLSGAAVTHRLGEAEDPVEARLRTTFFEPARADHGAEAWDAAAGEGAALGFEEAIAYALEERGAPAVA